MEYTAAHLKQLLDLTSYSVNIKDANKRYTYVNKRFEEVVKNVQGYEQGEIIGKTAKEVWSKQVRDKNKLCALGKEPRRIYMQEAYLKDKKVTIETQVISVRDKVGKISGKIELSEIIRKEDILDKILSSRHEEIARMYNIFKKNKRFDWADIDLDEMIETIFSSLKCDYLKVYIYDDENEKVVKTVTKVLGVDSEIDAHEIDGTEEELNNFFEYTEVNFLHHISEVNIKEKHRKVLKEIGIEYLGSYPIKFKEQIWGSITIGYRRKNGRPYFEKKYMNNLCEKIIWGIKNHYLIHYLLQELSLGEKVNQELDVFFNSATDFLCILDNHLRIKKINYLWANNLGYTCEAIKGKSIYELIYEEDVEKSKEIIKKRINTGRDITNTARYKMADGSIRWISWKGEWVVVDGRKIAIGVGKDINQEKIAEEKRVKLIKTLEQEKHKNLFFSTLSHEFKTPLNIILSITQLLEQSIDKDSTQNEEQVLGRYIDIINRNAYKTLKVANNLIDLIKMDTRTEKLDYKYYNIVEVVEEITIEVAKFIKDKKLTITFDTEIEEKVVWCHEESIERIMLNLLSNAIKYSPEDGEILVYIKAYKRCIGIYVEDQGIGIGHASNEPIDTGSIIWKSNTSGLGLKIIDQLIGLHKGKLIIEDIKPMGTRMIVTLPITEEEQCEAYTYRGELSDRHRESCKKELCDI